MNMNMNMNDYGTIMSDLTKPFEFHTQLFQYDHDNECMQFTTNLIQTNRFDIKLPNGDLTDIESELRRLGRPLSRVPKEKQIRPVTKNFDTNRVVCKQKIITN